ncbi:4Fe-4S dicluster domain-containing protein [Candidatus Fermentibacteria bacterium]|nr:4Fe-4S dicluster domain-containing protein [Candidatus Fermentibacteria bacterium]
MAEKAEAGTKPGKAPEEGAEKPLIRIYPEWCKGCGICVAFCPKQVLEMGEDQKAHVAHPERCIRCFLCARRCPDFAIALTDEEGRAVKKEGDDQ